MFSFEHLPEGSNILNVALDPSSPHKSLFPSLLRVFNLGRQIAAFADEYVFLNPSPVAFSGGLCESMAGRAVFL